MWICGMGIYYLICAVDYWGTVWVVGSSYGKKTAKDKAQYIKLSLMWRIE